MNIDMKNTFYILTIVIFCFFSTKILAIDSSISAGSNTSLKVNVDSKLIIKDIWARPSLSSNNNSAAYMKITNPSSYPIVIIGASASSVANNVELHKSFVDTNGVSKMTLIDKILVPANSTIELAPGGIHIMLYDLKRSLIAGDKFEITLKLDEMEEVIVESLVK